MPEDDPLAAVETFLRDRAMAYPEATEEFPWGHRAVKVKKKIFLILDRTEGVVSVTVKLPDSHAYALMQPYAERTGYGLGKSGWVSCRFAAGDDPPLDLLEEWLEESYRAVAPKKLVLALNAREAGGPEPPPAKPKRGPKKSPKSEGRKS
jgi:predicted DNA-binding protein (MmcQ/YjbR family)